MRKKVTIVGAGMVGSSCAQMIVGRGYADIVLVDVVEGLPQGKALDLLEAGPVVGYDSQIIGSNDYEASANSDIAIITAGLPRKPGMTRDDLLLTNMKIVTEVIENLVKHSPNCIVIVVTNPLDAMAYLVYKLSGFPRERVVGMAGVLDTARFRTFLAQELNVSVEDVTAYVLGGHGDTMVPLVRYTAVGGLPITDLLPQDRIDAIVQRTRAGGAEIVKYLKTGSAFYAPSAAVTQMVDAIILDKNQVLPCAVYLQGEYGINDVFVGVPVKLGAGGIKEIIEIKLSAEEQKALNSSAESVQELVEIMRTKESVA